MITIRPARPGDARGLVPRLRHADLQEFQAVSRDDPVAALERGIALSDPCYAAVDGETVLVLFGVYPQPGTDDVGIVWLLGSDDITTYSRLFLRLCRPWLEKLQ